MIYYQVLLTSGDIDSIFEFLILTKLKYYYFADGYCYIALTIHMNQKSNPYKQGNFNFNLLHFIEFGV